ncbi:MAG: hypothetical protein QW041_02900 [Candidatus Pacearchaeota archaeon]
MKTENQIKDVNAIYQEDIKVIDKTIIEAMAKKSKEIKEIKNYYNSLKKKVVTIASIAAIILGSYIGIYSIKVKPLAQKNSLFEGIILRRDIVNTIEDTNEKIQESNEIINSINPLIYDSIKPGTTHYNKIKDNFLETLKVYGKTHLYRENMPLSEMKQIINKERDITLNDFSYLFDKVKTDQKELEGIIAKEVSKKHEKKKNDK